MTGSRSPSASPTVFGLWPDLVPGSAAARSAFERELAELGAVETGGVIVCANACLLQELLARVPDSQRFEVALRWSFLDPFLPSAWHEAARALAEVEAARFGLPVREVEVPELASSAPVGLAIEARARAAVLAKSLDREALMLALRDLAPALHPRALGLDADASMRGIGLLREACAAHACGLRDELQPQKPAEIRGRVKALEIGGAEFAFRWSRSRGARWTLPGAREAEFALALEVQGDRAAPASEFEPGFPERPRVFLASDSKPTHRCAAAPEGSWLRFEREICFAESAELKRKRAHDFTLEVRADAERETFDVAMDLRGALPAHRYRLWLPIASYPRPARFASAGEPREIEGAWGPCPVDGQIEFSCPSATIVVESPNLVEAEVFAHRNDYVCAVTLLRGASADFTSVSSSFTIRRKR